MSEQPKGIFAILSEIKTIDDLKENKKLIVETAVSEFENWFKVAQNLALSPEPPQSAMMKFNQIETDMQVLRDDIDEDIYRLREIPGADDIIMKIQGELVNRYGAITSKMSMLLPQIMGGGEPSAASGPPQPPGPPPSGGGTPAAPKDKYERMIFRAYTPAEGEKFEALETLKTIHSERMFNAKRDEILKQMNEHYKNELEKVTELKGKDQSSDEVQNEIKDFTNRFLYFQAEVGSEFNRLEAVMGKAEPVMGLSDELAKNTMSIGEDIMKTLEELGADKMKEFNKPPEIEIVKLGEEREELEALAEIYQVNSGEELMKIKDEFFNKLQKILETNLETLKDIKSGKYPEDETVAKVDEVEHQMNLIGNEMENEFKRIEALPGGREAVDAFTQEAQSRFVLVDEIMDLLDEL